MLRIKDLSAWFPHPDSVAPDSSEVQVLHDVSLRVNSTQTVALVGESGSGKSITALSVLRLLEESTAIRVTGSITFDDDSFLELPLDFIRTIRGNRIGMIFQEPMTSLNPVYTVGNQLIESIRQHRTIDHNGAEKEALRLLERTRIDEPQARLRLYPHQLSGGQRQRIMIAMALASRPSLLIADEPTTALDVTIQAQILQLIRDIQLEDKMGMLLITHDLAMVRKIAEYIYIMKDGRIVEHGETDTIFHSPQHPYTRHLMTSIPTVAQARVIDSPVFLKTDKLSCSFKLVTGTTRFLQKKTKVLKAVDEVSLEIRKGTTCGIIGESGSGKTTLGMALLRLAKSSGQILFDNENLQELSQKQLRPFRSRMQVVFQDPYSSLSPRMTIGEIVEEGLRVHQKGLSKRDRQRLVVEALADVGLEAEVISRYPHEFSGGQRQRIAIARVIILRPELLILDEPTSALDMTIQAQILSLLQELQQKYDITYLFISHDLKVIRALADYIIVMRNGRIIEEGPAQTLFKSPSTPYTKELFQAAFLTGS
jgi:microcin C transport system ATP-binding protein